MRCTASFLFFFTLRSFVAVGNAHPVGDLELEKPLENDNVTKPVSVSASDASAAWRTCVYIPPDLDFCNFISYQKSKENLWDLERKLSEKKMRKLLKSNKMYLSHSSARVPDELVKQKSAKTIIYKIQRCVPPR